MHNARSRFIAGTTMFAAALVVVTELLSLAHAITRPVAFVLWIPVAFPGLLYLIKRIQIRSLMEQLKSLDLSERLILAAITLIVAVNLLLALLAAPSAYDALSYHVPRLDHWIENQSIAHYPTWIDRQLWIGPGWEYFALQLQLLAGNDRLINCVEWLSFIGCVVVSSQLALQLGASRRGQIFAAFFTATLPMAIAQASGSQVDMFASFWIASAVSLILEQIGETGPISLRRALILGACIGLSVLSKATAYLLLFPFIVWLAIVTIRRYRFRILGPIAMVFVGFIVMNAGIYSRNYAYYGTVLGTTSGPPLENAIITPASVASTIVRNIAMNGHSRFARLNSIENRIVRKLHAGLRIDPSDIKTTYFGARYYLRPKPRSEGYVGNPFHLLAIAAAITSLFLASGRDRSRLAHYSVALIAAFILFSAILRWQPWHNRLMLPLFVLSSGLVATIAEMRLRRTALSVAGFFLFAMSSTVLLANSMRPVVSSKPIWTVPREQRYFIETRDMYGQHVAVGRFLAARGCSNVGLVTSWLDLEDLLTVVIRNRARTPVRITHLVEPGQPISEEICAVVTDFMFPGERSPSAQVPPGWSLALDRAPLQVYIKGE